MPLRPTGFWCYTSADETAADGRLHRLRTVLAEKLAASLGDSSLRLFQDTGLLEPDTEAAFMLVILTPAFLRDPLCNAQLRAFLSAMQRAGRSDMVIPIHYEDVDDFETARRSECVDTAMYEYLATVRWVDFRPFRLEEPDGSRAGQRLDRVVSRITEAMRAPDGPAVMATVMAVDRALAPDTESNLEAAADPLPEAVPLPKKPVWKRTTFRIGAALAGLITVFFLAKNLTKKPPPPPPEPPSQWRDCRDCPELALIPAGTFTMGMSKAEAEQDKLEADYARPQRAVKVSPRFYMGKYTITRGEYRKFVEATKAKRSGACWTFEKAGPDFYSWQLRDDRDWQNPGFPQTDQDPAVCVSASEAETYAVWLSAETHRDYRLPSEAEWEYAARAGTASQRYWPDDGSPLCRHANLGDISLLERAQLSIPKDELDPDCNDGFAFTAPVGSFPPNPFGLFDMYGNVWQWTSDFWHDDYKNAPNDSTPWIKDGLAGRRGVRGGYWASKPGILQSGVRDVLDRDSRSSSTGFRLVRTIIVPTVK